MSQRVVLCLLLLGCAPPVGQVGESAQPLQSSALTTGARSDDHEDAWLRDLARNSVVTLMRRPAMNATDPNNIRFGESYEVFNMCPEERFGGDPGWGHCSGTLIDDDLVLTAGHCLAAVSCANTAISFNYLRDQPGVINPLTTDDVYFCKSVVLQQYGTDIRDYAIVQLDRKATPRYHPMPVRFGRMPLSDRPVALLGAPLGMPLKIDDSGSVYQEDPAGGSYFWINNDGFHGDSGGPIIDLTTYQEVGMLTGGDLTPDLIWDDVRSAIGTATTPVSWWGNTWTSRSGTIAPAPAAPTHAFAGALRPTTRPPAPRRSFRAYGQPQAC